MAVLRQTLEQLRNFSVIVADTGDFESIKTFCPTDATTNPSLILKAAQKPEYRHILECGKNEFRKKGLSTAIDNLIVSFGLEILKIIKGRVSTEVDARLSFDSKSTIQKAKNIIQLYEDNGIQRERILIKIASTWEGICAAKVLEGEGIHCNLTLLFSKTQAIACANSGITLISPFVGRVLDWYKQKSEANFSMHDDPGVKLVTEIFQYYKYFNFNTEIMAASFRNVDQIINLAGCDLLTISPALLSELKSSSRSIDRKLISEDCKKYNFEKISYDEQTFRYELNANAMATEKLAEGIRLFASDTEKLESLLIAD